MADWENTACFNINVWVKKDVNDWVDTSRGDASRSQFVRELLERELRSSNDDRSNTK